MLSGVDNVPQPDTHSMKETELEEVHRNGKDLSNTEDILSGTELHITSVTQVTAPGRPPKSGVDVEIKHKKPVGHESNKDAISNSDAKKQTPTDQEVPKITSEHEDSKEDSMNPEEYKEEPTSEVLKPSYLKSSDDSGRSAPELQNSAQYKSCAVVCSDAQTVQTEAEETLSNGDEKSCSTVSQKPKALTFKTVAKDIAQQIRILVALRKLKKVSKLPTKRKASVVTPKIQLMCEMLETRNKHKIDPSKADSDQLLERNGQQAGSGDDNCSPKLTNTEMESTDTVPIINIMHHGESKVHFESPEGNLCIEDRLLKEIDLELAVPGERLVKTKSSVVSLNNDRPEEQLMEHFAQLGHFVRDL